MELELYVHIPFCRKKCLYCDFLSFADQEGRERYIGALAEEIRYYAARYGRDTVRSVFIGGGTPSLLTEDELYRIADAIHKGFSLKEDAEWTLEANPATFDLPLARFWRTLSINRISMGVQSFDDRLLKRIGRIHSAKQAEEGFSVLRRAGFDNLSMDLMMGLPSQSASDFAKTLATAVRLSPEHLSCYSLIVEEGTPFYEEERLGRLDLPDEDEERRMYHDTLSFLREKGYEQYEISNFAKPGRACLHNIGYWKRVPYIGFGLGAASLLNEVRLRNQDRLTAYLAEDAASHRVEAEPLDLSERMSEFMFLGLRMNEGVRAEDFLRTFGAGLEEVYGPSLKKLIAEGLLIPEDEKRGFHLSKRGLDLANFVFREFIPEK